MPKATINLVAGTAKVHRLAAHTIVHMQKACAALAGAEDARASSICTATEQTPLMSPKITHAFAPRTTANAAMVALVALLVSLAILSSPFVASAAPTVSATIDRTTLSVGDTATLRVVVTGTQNCSTPSIPVVDGLRISYIGPTTRMTITNGQIDQSVTYNFVVMGIREGTYSIPAISLTVDGVRRTTDPITVAVTSMGRGSSSSQSSPGTSSQPQATGSSGTGGSAQGGSGSDQSSSPSSLDDLIYAVIQPAKETAYPGEEIPVTVTLYIDSVTVRQVSYPNLSGQGFLSSSFSEPTQSDQIVNGRRVHVVSFTTKITAVSSGKLTIGPATIECEVSVPRDSRRGSIDDFFGSFDNMDSFFGSFFGRSETRSIDVTSDSATINVLPFPTDSKPEGFKGAVGQFSVSASASPTTVKAGEPITVEIEVWGNGNLRSVSAPTLTGSSNFRIYDATVKDSTDGSKIFEQVVVPTRGGISEIPSFSLVYFDPTKSKYVTATTDPIPIKVEGAAAPTSGPAQTQTTSNADGIVFIKQDIGRIQLIGAGLLSRPLALPGLIIAGVGALLLLWYAVALKLGIGPGAGRKGPSTQRLIQSLVKLQRSLDTREPADVILEAGNLVLEATKGFQGPAGLQSTDRGLNRSEGSNRGSGTGEGRRLEEIQGLNSKIAEFAHAFDILRFSPTPKSKDDAGAFLALGLSVAETLAAMPGRRGLASATRNDSSRPAEAGLATARPAETGYSAHTANAGQSASAGLAKAARPVGDIMGLAAISLIVLALGGLSIRHGATVGPDIRQSFEQGCAAYQNGQFAEARAAFEGIIEQGYESGNVYFNLGNTYMKLGNYGKAIANYLRAYRFIPRDPDLKYNLSAAERASGLAEEAHSIGGLSVLRRSTPDEWLSIGLIMSLFILIVHGLRLSVARSLRLARPLIGVASVLLISAVAASSYTYLVSVRDERAVVLNASAPVRFDPTDTGSVRYVAREGEVLQMLGETRDNFVKVASADGQRGWVSSSDIDPLRPDHSLL